MFDKEYIKRVCDLSLNEEDYSKSQILIKYDLDKPFKKYYNINIITSALNKYLLNEWSEEKLTHWACHYMWVLNGGFDGRVIEDLSSLENLYLQIISNYLDELSFFSSGNWANPKIRILNLINSAKDFDHIWQRINHWKAYYMQLNSEDENLLILVNDIDKLWAYLFAGYLIDTDNSGVVNKISENEFKKLFEKLHGSSYKILDCSEEVIRE